MTFVAVFLVNAGLSFALSLAVAYLVGPEAFGRYAVGLSLAIVLNTALFEGLRLATTRFYSERTRVEAPEVRSTLDLAYLAVAGIAIAALAIVLGAGVTFGLSRGLVAASVAAGVTLALFDYRTALARARFLGRAYAGLHLSRGTGAFGLAVAAAWAWGDPALVLGGAAVAAALVAAASLRPLADRQASIGRATLGLAVGFARYAAPLVAASAVYQLLPLLNRLALAREAGFAEAGFFALASEIALRLFQNLGSALDLALFQVAVRVEERDGREAAERQIARNLAMVAAILIPAATGFWMVWPSFELMFVPPAFRGQLAPTVTFAIPAVAAYALVQYGLNPVFQLRRRTAPTIAAAIVALVVDLGLLAVWLLDARAGTMRPDQVAAVQLASFGGALVCLTILAARAGFRFPWRDLALAVCASAAMAAILHALPVPSSAAAALTMQAACGVAAYLGLALIVDLAGARTAAATLVRRAGASTGRTRPEPTPDAGGRPDVLDVVAIGRPAASRDRRA